MIKMLSFLLILMSLPAMGQPSLPEVRKMYRAAESNRKAAERMLEQLESVGAEEPVLLAYRASGTMMMAKHVFSPFSKMSYFNKGKKMLQEAVDLAPDNVEIRFLRFAIQESTPGFLGYKDRMAEDKAFLLREVPKLKEGELKGLILPFLKNSEYLSEAEKERS